MGAAPESITASNGKLSPELKIYGKFRHFKFFYSKPLDKPTLKLFQYVYKNFLFPKILPLIFQISEISGEIDILSDLMRKIPTNLRGPLLLRPASRPRLRLASPSTLGLFNIESDMSHERNM